MAYKLTFPNSGSLLTSLTSSIIDVRNADGFTIQGNISSSFGASGSLELQVSNYTNGVGDSFLNPVDSALVDNWFTVPESVKSPCSHGTKWFGVVDFKASVARVVYTALTPASGTIDGSYILR